MKALFHLNNVERAKILFELVPADIAAFIAFEKEMADFIVRDPEPLRKNWDNPLFSLGVWVRLATDASTAIEKYGERLSKNSRLFTDQLFDGYTALFSAHCLQQFVQHEELKDPKFKAAVELFFGL
jgi:hypothetical protein